MQERGETFAIDAFMHDARADRAIIFSFSFRLSRAHTRVPRSKPGNQATNAATMAACTNRK